MEAYGLIGFPVSHSFSPKFFKEKFVRESINAVYTAFALEHISDLPKLLRQHPELRGLNVTIPHKQSVIPLLDELDPVAEQIGAVNCITIQNGRTKGFNTDVIGFVNSLKPILRPHHTHALVLGTGGASKAICHALQSLDIQYRLVSRTPASDEIWSYEQIDSSVLEVYSLLINTTPLGTYPDIENCPPLPYQYLSTSHLLYDLVYNPEETQFLKLGRSKGAATKNGFEMLQLQALAAWDIWQSHQ